MIYDRLDAAHRYRALGPDFAAVFDRLRDRTSDWPVGRTEMRANDLWFSVVRKAARSPLNAGFEYHHDFADMHFCLQGVERIGWRESAEGLPVRAPFDASADFGLYDGTPTQFFALTSDRFAIFFPGELHAPLIGEGELTKVCVKIRLNSLA